jgi:tRNA 2-thiouridine synthesizing protein B
MATLHTINKSPFERNSLDSCLRLAMPGSTVLLIEDAVVGAMQGTQVAERIAGALENLQFYVLGPDLQARGLAEDHLITGMQVVDYGGFVDLTASHDRVHAWL